MSTLKVDTITDTTGLLAPVFPTTGSAQLNPMAGREDKIINGDFGYWQRGVSGASLGYVADRWANQFSGGTITHARQAFAIGDTLGVTQPSFYLRQTVSGHTLASSYALTTQRIESVRSYAGQTITVLGWARRSSGTGNMAFEGIQSFGSGGSPSAVVNTISPTPMPLTGSWVPFAVVVNVPAITGKTLGTSGDDFFALYFWTSSGTDWSSRTSGLGLQTIGVDFWGIHIRQGTWTAAATADYRPRDPGTELALCQRYCSETHVTLGSGATGICGVHWYTKVTMRTTPSITVFAAGGASGAAATLDTVYDANGGFFQVNVTAGGGGVTYRRYRLDAEI